MEIENAVEKENITALQNLDLKVEKLTSWKYDQVIKVWASQVIFTTLSNLHSVGSYPLRYGREFNRG